MALEPLIIEGPPEQSGGPSSCSTLDLGLGSVDGSWVVVSTTPCGPFDMVSPNRVPPNAGSVTIHYRHIGDNPHFGTSTLQIL